MFDHEIRWLTLLALAVLFGIGHLASETAGLWFGFPARPDWLWAVAFYAVLRTTPTSALVAFASCGVIRDVILGPRLGSAAIAYILIGWVVLSWRLLASEHNFLTAMLLAGVTAFLQSLIRHSLDYGFFTFGLVDRIFFISVGDGVLTGIAYLPLALILGLPSLRPWQERNGF